jgi:hypothetical protein
MKDFFGFTVRKILFFSIIFSVAIPFINTGIVFPCFVAPCPEVKATILTWIWHQYDFVSVEWGTLIVGLLGSYILASIIYYFNKKDFLLSVVIILLQLGSVFLAQEIIVGNNSSEDILAICLMLGLAFLGYWFFRKRKRILPLILGLPMILLGNLIF